jgi:hypothetical protein
MECWGGTDGLRSAKNEYVGEFPKWSNFVVWWDGDLVREMLNGTAIETYQGDRLLTANGASSIGGTKATPNIQADILGDWREEVVYKTIDNQNLRIYTTTSPTEYGFYTLMHDPQYRLAITWQNVGYNQPPHPGFFLGDGMDTPPIPDIKMFDPDDCPILNIVTPVKGFELGLGLDLDVIVHGVGISDTNKMVIISDGNTPLDTIHSAPYKISIPGLGSGTHSIKASSYDNSEKLFESNPVNITVDRGFPHVSVTSPIANTSYLPEDSITFSADAYDTDGAIDISARTIRANDS